MKKLYAYAYASGLIAFGYNVPSIALPIASGRSKPLREYIDATARHGYKTRKNKYGRPQKLKGTEHLLVPGVPEAPLLNKDPLDALIAYCAWIGKNAPASIHVHGSK